MSGDIVLGLLPDAQRRVPRVRFDAGGAASAGLDLPREDGVEMGAGSEGIARWYLTT